jgi:hypothetical protein
LERDAHCSFADHAGRNTFPVPDIPQEACLLLCPQTMLLGLLFADKAFAVPDFTPAELFQLRIPHGKRELVIPIDESKADLPLFRGVERTVHGVRMSSKAVTENWLRERLRPLGEITSFDWIVKPYSFRRGHGEALDSSSALKIFALTMSSLTHPRLHQRFSAQSHHAARQFCCIPAQLSIALRHSGYPGGIPRSGTADGYHSRCEWDEPLNRSRAATRIVQTTAGDGRPTA